MKNDEISMDIYAKWNNQVWFHMEIHKTKSKFEHISWTVYHAMDDTMMNLKTTYIGSMNPNDNKTYKSRKPNSLDWKKTPYAYETCHVLIWMEPNEMQALGRLMNELIDDMNHHNMYHNEWMTLNEIGLWLKRNEWKYRCTN